MVNLEPLPFLLYINDIVKKYRVKHRLSVDDKSIFIIVENSISAPKLLNSDLEKLQMGIILVCYI